MSGLDWLLLATFVPWSLAFVWGLLTAGDDGG